MDVIEINYDDDLWAFVDSLLAWGYEGPDVPKGGLFLGHGSPILGNQFTLLATVPRELGRTLARGIPANLTIGNVQEIFEDTIIPALSSALDHMADAEAGGGPIVVLSLDEEETEIDQGELLLFDASLRVARAAFRIFVSYDFDLWGDDMTYGWLDEIRSLDFCENYSIVVPGAAADTLIDVNAELESAARDSILFEVLQHNLDRAAFLALDGNQMNAAWTDLRTARDMLQGSVEAIHGEGDPQEDDVIKIADLTDIETDLAGWDDRPNFAEHWETIEDVLTWVETVMSGTYHISEDGPHGPIELDVNLSALFTNAPPDLKDLLPYHRFRPSDEWITWSSEEWGYPIDPAWEQCYYVNCEDPPICRSGFEWRGFRSHYYDGMPIDLLDGPGGDPIDPSIELPYLPDYTIHGLFPGADRAKWLEIFAAIGG
jgi:hypothetical protein